MLIAMPHLTDPNFLHGVTIICEHQPEGAMGLLINRPMEISIEAILSQMGIPTLTKGLENTPVYYGGPVDTDRGFVLHTGNKRWPGTIEVSSDIKVTSSKDILLDIANATGPQNFLFVLGYAGWGAGQLDQEILANAWLTTEAEKKFIFDTPAKDRWSSAANKLGIYDLDLMTSEAGHA